MILLAYTVFAFPLVFFYHITTGSSSLLLGIINNYTQDKMLKGLFTATTAEHYNIRAAHYNRSLHVVSDWMFLKLGNNSEMLPASLETGTFFWTAQRLEKYRLDFFFF